LFTVAISVAAMPSHLARQAHHHREIAKVVGNDDALVREIAAREVSLPAKRIVRKKRASNGRCGNGSSAVPPSSSDTVESPLPSQLQGNQKKNPVPTSTSQDPASTPTPQDSQPSSSIPAPEPSTSPSQHSPAPTPTTSPTPTPTSGGNSNGQTYTGQGTYYDTGLGACGIVNTNTDFIAAAAKSFFDSYPGYDGVNPNHNPMCGKIASVTYQGKNVQVSLTDRCEGCAYGDLDFSPAAFDKLADPSVGRISGIQWQIIN